MKKSTKTITAMIVAGAILASNFMAGERVAAADNKVTNLKSGKEYSYDLDGDGVKEKLKYTLTSKQVYQIYVNDKVLYKKTLGTEGSNRYPMLQITDINTEEAGLDLWVYTYYCSDDVEFASLVQYKDGKMKEIYKDGVGELYTVDGKGTFYQSIQDKLPTYALVGTHYDSIPYCLKNGKVKKVKTNTYKFSGVFSSQEKIKGGVFKAARVLKFYKKPNTKSKVAFKVKKGQKVTVISTYYKNGTAYVKFKNAKGKKGYLKVTKSAWKKPPFTNLSFFG